MNAQPLPKDDKMLNVEQKLRDASKTNDVETLLSLLKKAVDVNAADVVGRVALHWASAKGQEPAVHILVDHDADVNTEDKYGMTPALYATWFGHLQILKILVSAGAVIPHTNMSGQGLLHCAAARGRLDIVEYILEELEDNGLDRPDEHDKTPFLLAAENGKLNTLQCLRQRGCNIKAMDKEGNSALHLAASSGHPSVVRELMNALDLEVTNQEGKTALLLATETGQTSCVEALLTAGCDVNTLSNTGHGALHCAAQKGQAGICRLLLDSGVDTSTSSTFAHLTPLHLAVMNNYPDIVQMFTEAGCDLNTRDENGQTALHVAAELRRLEITEVLLKANVLLDLKDKKDRDPLDLAIRGYYANVVDTIIKAERFYKWRRESEPGPSSEVQLDFALDHLREPRPVRSVLWTLAESYLQPGEWKKLADYWQFPVRHVKAIESQWTGNRSYKEHGFRMFLIWLHGITAEGKHPIRELYEGLVGIGNRTLAEKVRRKASQEERPGRRCLVM
uniref:Death domain-containing protein n=1 Tax=Lepisosteus oculatus TaxID=7918 RepID=W5MQ00_LEPOC